MLFKSSNRDDPMRRVQCLLIAIGLMLCLPGDAAVGQLIRIFNNGGGVDIRVPFVRVQTDGYGGSYVRAPFVQVVTPTPYFPAQPYYVQPAQPGYVQPPTRYNHAPAYAPGQTVMDRVGPTSQPAISPGPPSLDSLSPNAPVAVPAREATRPSPERALPAESGADADVSSGELKSVLAGQGPVDGLPGLRQQLVSSARDLDRALLTYSNASLWQDYLQLPAIIDNESLWLDPASISQDQRDQLKRTLDRFDRTASRPDMRLINQFESFQRVHQQLASLLEVLPPLAAPVQEELPPPRGNPGR